MVAKNQPREHILACQPADESERARIEKVMGTKLPQYTGSVRGECAGCKTAVLLGPRQQAVRRQGSVTILCFVCATVRQKLHEAMGDEVEINNLGNPEHDK